MSQDVVTEPLRVVLADDHAEYREGVARLLREHHIDVVAEVSNGEAAVSAVEELAPDVVVMDLSLPGLSGLEATRLIGAKAPASRVLVLTTSAREADLTEAIVAGAMGYVLKEDPVEEIVAGIRTLAAGESVISPQIAPMLMQRMREGGDASGAPDAEFGGPRLTARELEVLCLMAKGRSNHEIAEDLTIGITTVRKHVTSILIKLHVENRVQAAVQAVRNRLV
jgi:DNA-binding NarL/FixJ family response regulator